MWDDFGCGAMLCLYLLLVFNHHQSVCGLDCLHVFVVAVVGVCEEWCEDELCIQFLKSFGHAPAVQYQQQQQSEFCRACL